MNVSTKYDIELLYERMGSSWIVDSVYLLVTTPIGFIGGILNLLSLFIIYKIKIDQTNLYKYLSFYSINGSFFCFLCSLVFIGYSPRYCSYYLGYFARIYRGILFIMIAAISYFIGNMLDIIIALDRLSIFIKSFKPFTKYNPFIVCLVITIISILVNLPIAFSYYVKNDQEFYNDINYSLSSFVYSGRTEYFYSNLATIVSYIQVFIRDITTLVLEILTSSLALYYLKKFNKHQIEMNLFVTEMNEIRREVIRKRIIKDRQLLLVNLIQTIISFISHVLVCVSYVYASRGISSELFTWLCIGYLANCFKHFTNFFIFYFFNSNFKNKFKNLFLCKN